MYELYVKYWHGENLNQLIYSLYCLEERRVEH